ncbi:MAG: tRNA pseudouridine(55) synthase TruB, partial [Ilumatobacteraceae bacterium]
MAKRRPPTIHGLAIVDKPAGVTSHDVVNQLRKQLGERRIGHAGTLDPDATGVLLVGVGYVTRLLQFLSGLDKTYTAEVVLGTETNTLDSSGTVTATHDMSKVTPQLVRQAAQQLTGNIMQVPPMVSAIQIGGKRLHQLAREGIEVERKPRPVTIY